MNIIFCILKTVNSRLCDVSFWSNHFLALFIIKSLSPHLSPSLCLTSSLIYLPSSNVKRLLREAGSPGADCVFELMISSYSVILWSSGAQIVFSAHTITVGENCIYKDFSFLIACWVRINRGPGRRVQNFTFLLICLCLFTCYSTLTTGNIPTSHRYHINNSVVSILQLHLHGFHGVFEDSN